MSEILLSVDNKQNARSAENLCRAVGCVLANLHRFTGEFLCDAELEGDFDPSPVYINKQNIPANCPKGYFKRVA